MPRKLYNFKKEKTTGEETHFSPHQLEPAGDYNLPVNGQMFMSPYTDFIPLSYLLTIDGYGGMYNPIGDVLRDTWRLSVSPDKLKAFNNRWNGKIFTIFPTQHLGETIKYTKEHTVVEMEKWLKRDAICNFHALEIDSTSDRQRILSSFEDNQTLKFRQQTYSGSISPYSLYLSGRGGPKAHMLAVVLPENYLYLKYHLLVHNTIPLDKVIILINKDLDRGDYENPPFKKLYRELLLKIARSSCQVWKVPVEFIQEACFMDTYRLKSTNIVERKREIEGVIQEFYESFGGVASAQPVGNREQSIGDRDLVMNMGDGRVRWEPANNQGVYVRGIQPDEQAFMSTMDRAARVENQPQQFHPGLSSNPAWTNTGSGTYQYSVIGAHTPTIVGSGASVLTGTSVANHPPFVDPPHETRIHIHTNAAGQRALDEAIRQEALGASLVDRMRPAQMANNIALDNAREIQEEDQRAEGLFDVELEANTLEEAMVTEERIMAEQRREDGEEGGYIDYYETEDTF